MLAEITHAVTADCCSFNLCANINGHSQQSDPAEINPETTLIPFTLEEINITPVGVEIDKINDFGKQSQCEAALLAPLQTLMAGSSLADKRI